MLGWAGFAMEEGTVDDIEEFEAMHEFVGWVLGIDKVP